METPECCGTDMTRGAFNWHCFTCGEELEERVCPHCDEKYVEFHMCRDTQESYD